ncbi:MAG: DNRLRE domain-containing protein [Armatimonadota bacterium]
MRKHLILLTALLMLCLGTGAFAAIGTVDIPLTQGLRFTGYAPWYADQYYSFGSYGTLADSPNRLLFKFGELDRFASVTNAVVTLYKYQAYSADGLNVDCYQVTSSWGGGTCWNNQPGYSGSPIASARWNFWDGDSHHFSLDVTSSVQGWFANPSTNYGFMFKQQNESLVQDIWYFDGTRCYLRVTGELLPVVEPLTFTPDGGTFSAGVDVTVSCATPGVTIRCTTDGSDPTTTNGAVIASGNSIRVLPTATLKAKAWKSGYYPSDIKAAIYTCMATVPFSQYLRITGAAPYYADTYAYFGAYPGAPDSPSRLLGKLNIDRFERIDSAILNMYKYQAYVATTMNAACHQITDPWADGTCWANQPSFNATPAATASWGYWDGDSHNFTLDVTAMAQGWKANPSANYGIVLKQQDESAAGDLWFFNMGPTQSYLRVMGKLAITPENCGAVGDGVTDDTTAFQRAAQAIQAAGGGTFTLTAGKTYRVGRQYHVAGQYPYYKHESIFAVQDLPNKVTIQGNGALVKINDGLRFGSFDKDTGAAINPAMPFYDWDCKTEIGNVFQFFNCNDVEICDVRIDGNINGHVLGGGWGDTGRQLAATGIWLYNNRNVNIVNTESSYHALDGIIIGYQGLNSGSDPTPHSLQTVNCFYNARQGLSWVGGIGLTADNCKFSHTGKMRFCSSPGAGVDLEAEESVVRNGNFSNCEFVNNTGCGMVADCGDVANATFSNCLFWGTTFWSVWPRKPGMQFTDCTIRGTAVNLYGSTDATQATQFLRCTFDDQPGLEYGVYRAAGLVEIDAHNAKFDSCTFKGYQNRSMWVDGGTTNETLTNCSIYHYANNRVAGDFQALIRGANINNTHFYESGLTNPYYIEVGGVHVGPSVYVDGPCVKWGSTSGLTGLIPQN